MQGALTPGAVATDCVQEGSSWDIAWHSRHSPAMDRAERAQHLARALECEVIPRLAAAHGQAANERKAVVALAATTVEVVSFTDAVLAGDESAVRAAIADLRGRGLRTEELLMTLLAPSARRFGELWVEDRCDFAAVTVGLGRLQGLMREWCPAFGSEVGYPSLGRRVLLVRAPTEQHGFGLSMVAEFFRRAGWDVSAGGALGDANPVEAVRREWFDVVGLSAGSDAHMRWLPECIDVVRQMSRNRKVVVLVGGPVALWRTNFAAEVGADAASTDGSAAPALADSLLASRVKRP